MIEYKYFEIINAAAMKADSINPDGSFVFKDAHEAELFRIDAEKNKISYDDASAVNEFKIDNTNIIIYPNFDRAVFNIPLIKIHYLFFFPKILFKNKYTFSYHLISLTSTKSFICTLGIVVSVSSVSILGVLLATNFSSNLLC